MKQQVTNKVGINLIRDFNISLLETDKKEQTKTKKFIDFSELMNEDNPENFL